MLNKMKVPFMIDARIKLKYFYTDCTSHQYNLRFTLIYESLPRFIER